ncbi:hypothetical protein M0R45_003805 [Rubus argutus]|uniref:Uncharacterized protein n=1 Tax=Rubus argutus TaxID=59490 RepID=A0AAW1YGJ6_RUBAR
MASELFDLASDSPPASPTTPQPTSSTTAAASSPAIMQNQHQTQAAQPLPKRLRISEPAIDLRKPNEPAPVGSMRSSSESNVSGSGTKPKYSYYRLRGSLSKVHLAETDHKLLMDPSNPIKPVNCMAPANYPGSSLVQKSLEPRLIGQPGADIPAVGSPASSKKPMDVASQVSLGGSLLKMLLESAVAQGQVVSVTAPHRQVVSVVTPWREPPETLRLFPVEAPFFPVPTEKGSSSTIGRDDEDDKPLDLSAYRDEPAAKPGDMEWTLALPAPNAMVLYGNPDPVPDSGDENEDVEVDLDLSL